MAQIKVLALGDRLFAPHVNFLFASKKQTIGLDAPLLVDDCNGDGVDMQSLIQRAANERFHRELELSEAELYVSTAETLMPKAPIALTDKVIVKEVEPSTAVLTCWLHVELPVTIAARARGYGANEKYKALKTKAQLAGINFSNTEFAQLLGKKCADLVKALDRCANERTSDNGNLVSRIEKKLAEYGADLPKLGSLLEDVKASKLALKEDAAVRSAAATGPLAAFMRALPSCMRPCARPSHAGAGR